MKKFRFIAKKSCERLDLFLRDSLQSVSRSKIVKYIKDDLVKIDGKICRSKNTEVGEGSLVEISLPEEGNDFKPGDFVFSRLYEDEHILLLDKPEGMAVHPGSGLKEPSLSDYFRFYYPDLKNTGHPDRPGIVHRLDKGTSGVILLAKSEIAFSRLQKKFKQREVKKKYCAIVEGKLRYKNNSINTPIIRNPRDRRKFSPDYSGNSVDARDALTFYSLKYQFDSSAFIFLELHTGRTHQIRVHMSSIGNPVLGDELYGNKESFNRLALHAYSISFTHPVYKNIVIDSFASIPPDFLNYFKDERLKVKEGDKSF